MDTAVQVTEIAPDIYAVIYKTFFSPHEESWTWMLYAGSADIYRSRRTYGGAANALRAARRKWRVLKHTGRNVFGK